MPHKVKISGSRSLKKGSKKNSKKQSNSRSSNKSKKSLKHSGMDFTAILNDMSGHKSAMANMMGPQQMQQQPGMEMDQSGQMMDPNMMMQQPGMQGQMMDPNMMMMGKNAQSAQGQEQEVDPLHIQYIVPQNKNLNINNYGISYDQLLKGSQHNGLSDAFHSVNSSQNTNSVQQKLNNMRIN